MMEIQEEDDFLAWIGVAQPAMQSKILSLLMM
jgi:hypothetical protein